MPTASSDDIGQKPSAISPAMSTGELSVSGKVAAVSSTRLLHINGEGLQGEECQGHQSPYARRRVSPECTVCVVWLRRVGGRKQADFEFRT